MSDSDSQRNIPKRQIARLIGTSEFPIWVLSESLQLVFGNEAFIALLESLPIDLRLADSSTGNSSADNSTTGDLPGVKSSTSKPSVKDVQMEEASNRLGTQGPERGVGTERGLDRFLGMECKPDSIGESASITLLARWLAIPANTSNHHVRTVKDFLPSEWSSASRMSSDTQPHSQESGTGTYDLQGPCIRTLIPLGMPPEGCTLCMLKPDAGDLDTYRDVTFRSRIEIPALSLLDSEPSMDSWWYLHGNSPRTCTLRKQLELACSGNHPVHLIVPNGAPAIQLATWIFHERFQAKSASVRRDPPITIECKWMDKDLLSSVCEWIDDIRKQGRSPEVIIHLIDQLAPELREPLAQVATKQCWNAIITSSIAPSEQATRNSPHWARWIATFDVQTVELQPIAQRTEEIESLLLAWLRKHPGFRWNQAFLDALLAYAWPLDAEEFDQALNESIRRCQSEALRTNPSSDDPRDQEQEHRDQEHESKSQERLLDETHLPISLRTFPSHIERLSPPEPIVLDDELESYELKLIERALRAHPRNNTAAAKALGISRARLLRRMQQWGLGSPQSTTRPTDQVVFEEVESDE